MTFNSAIEYLQRNPDVLKMPIILTKNKILVGFHNIEIRQFIPKEKRPYMKF